MSGNIAQIWSDFLHFIDRITSGFPVKAGVAVIPSLFTTHLMGDWYIFVVWMAAITTDFICGVLWAVINEEFSRDKVQRWVVKVATHMLTILIAGIVTVASYRVSGILLPFINWLMFILLLTELASILDMAVKFNLPVPETAIYIVRKMRDRTRQKIDKALGDEGK